jgi:hypothetical protein
MKSEGGIFAIISFILFIELIILALKYPYENIYQFGIRITALIGFCSLFISVIMSNFFEEIDKKGEKKVIYHHLFGGLGIILIFLHPLLYALYLADFSIFIPRFDSWIIFWELAGRPSLILIIIGFIAGFLYKAYKKSWRGVHMLIYIGLFLGLIHGILIGTDFQNPFIVIIYILMFLISIYVLIDKRYKLRKEAS